MTEKCILSVHVSVFLLMGYFVSTCICLCAHGLFCQYMYLSFCSWVILSFA